MIKLEESHLQSILIEFDVPTKSVRLSGCSFSKVRADVHLSGAVPLQSGLKQGDTLSELKYMGATNGNCTHEEIKSVINPGKTL